MGTFPPVISWAARHVEMNGQIAISISILATGVPDAMVRACAKLLSEHMDAIGRHRSADELVAVLYATLAGDNARIFVATDAKESVLGIIFSNTGFSIEKAGRYLWINELHVSNSARRKAVATRLLTFVIDWCKSERMAGISLSADIGNKIASHLYHKLGFRAEAVNMFNLEFS